MATYNDNESPRPTKEVEEQWIREGNLHRYDGMILSEAIHPEVLDRVKTFPLFDGDIVASTYPRSGTAWSTEMTWLVCNEGDPNAANKRDLFTRVRFLEFFRKTNSEPEMNYLLETPPPRIIKTHLPAEYFKNQRNNLAVKFISVMRNYKDVLASLFHFNAVTCNQHVSWEEFLELTKRDILLYGNWADHCLSWWKLRHETNVLILKYEDIKHNPQSAICKIAQFCEKELSSEQVEAIAKHTAIDNMRNAPNHPQLPYVSWEKDLLRKGVVGDWRNHFTEEQARYIDEYMRDTIEKEGLFFEDKTYE